LARGPLSEGRVNRRAVLYKLYAEIESECHRSRQPHEKKTCVRRDGLSDYDENRSKYSIGSS